MAKTDATEFTTGTFELAEGIVLSRKMRVVGMLYLEEKYDMSMDQVVNHIRSLTEDGRMVPMLDMLVAMMLSHDPDMDPAEARKRLARLDTDDLTAATKIIKSGTETGDAEPEPAGNAEPPAAK